MIVRRKMGEAYWRQQEARWRSSGLSQAAYCTEHGLAMTTFSRWHCKFEKELALAGHATVDSPQLATAQPFVPVVIADAGAAGIPNPPELGSIRIAVEGAPWLVEVGRGFDPQHLRRVLAALRSTST